MTRWPEEPLRALISKATVSIEEFLSAAAE
jgi:hypothetical protein